MKENLLKMSKITFDYCIEVIKVKSVNMCGVNIVCSDDIIRDFKRMIKGLA